MSKRFNRRNSHTSLLMLLVVAWSSYAHAGLFGPSNYEECVLDGVKSAKTKAAVSAVYDACEIKFQSKEEKQAEAERKKIARKCGISDAADSKIYFIGVQDRPEVWSAIGNLKNHKLVDGYVPSLKFQNNNSRGVSGLMVGMGPKGKTCSANYSDYDATFYCGDSWAGTGVPPSSYGSVPCPSEIKNFAGRSYCIIGIRPLVNDGSGLARAMNDLGLCNK